MSAIAHLVSHYVPASGRRQYGGSKTGAKDLRMQRVNAARQVLERLGPMTRTDLRAALCLSRSSMAEVCTYGIAQGLLAEYAEKRPGAGRCTMIVRAI